MTTPHRRAVIDPSAGASGDMFLGALVAAGAGEDWLRDLPRRLDLAERVVVDIQPVQRASLAATKVTVTVGGEEERPGPHAHHSHHGHGPHRHVREIVARIEAGELSPTVKATASRVFRLLAEAEGRVHGKAPETVSLHEVGAWDALIDIVGTVEGFERLGVTEIHHTPIAVGRGWVEAAHGAMAVPAPATGILLEGLELASGGPVEGEAITPTGAALLKALSAGPPPARWRPVGQGWGAGARNPGGYANALRIWLAESASEAREVQIVLADMDDVPLEYLDPLRDALFAAGAVDVQVWATQMKKGRTGIRIEAQCALPELGTVSDAFFRHGTTAGVRHFPADRVVLPRRELLVEIGGQSIRVKVLDGPEGPRYKPEFDDVTAVARRSQLSALAVAQQAHDLARAVAGAKPNEEQQ
ncbi:MAG TPA: nickel pincer cofactor biosynthesis protein LarC [Gemmatimonadales bacterium]|nr:nickel pincer cofactor biosynthesis protein LarC [Gemmatimonadales bacterium]